MRVEGPGHATFEGGVYELRKTGRGEGDDTVVLVLEHPARVLWVPHLTPEPGDVAGDAVLRAPAVVFEDGLVLVVDVDDLAAAHGWRAWVDHEATSGTTRFAIGAYEEHGHVFYRRTPLAHDGPARLRVHVVRDAGDPFGAAARFLWQRWGRTPSASSLEPFLDHAVRWAFRSGWDVWQDVGAPVFIVDVSRHPSVPQAERTWREPRSIWNQAWFSTQRCANGLFLRARRKGDADLEARARAMTALALSAPQDDGLFPAVLVARDDGTWRWTNSDRRPPWVPETACHLADAAFTSRMLLAWADLTGDEAPRAYVARFAERLGRLRRADGAYPEWVGTESAGPESAVVASLLFELGVRDQASTLAFLEDVVREGRWEDFETYWSCAPWGTPGKRVARSGVFKQNTLSIAWCAEAFLLAYRATGERRHLLLARRCVDELSLYQAVWDPPWLPAPAHGGFGVMNGDCEWNDARQSLFAPLYLELGRTMQDEELVARGVAAMRASFSMMYAPENPALAKAYERRHPRFGPESWGFMMENQGHLRGDPIGTFTIFTWGPGSALATAELVRDRYPEYAARCGL